MSRSYLKFFGLAEAPFSLTSDPRFIYESRTFGVAMADVTAAVERREGLILITGGPGTGKTTLCRALVQYLGADTRLSAVPSPLISGSELVSQIVGDFGLVFPDDLQGFLVSLIPGDSHAVVIIDEAQHLEKGALEQVRRLAGMEQGTAKLLQIVLVGLPQLRTVLERDAPALDQIIARRCVLRPLPPEEVGPYIERRLEVARGLSAERGAPPPTESVAFSTAAIEEIAQLSRGVPRVINLLGDRSLDIALESGTREIPQEVVAGAAARLDLTREAPDAPAKTRLAVMGLIAATLAIAAVAVWGGVGRSRPRPSPAETPAPPVPGISETGPAAGSVPAPPVPPAAKAEVGTIPAVDALVLSVGSFGSDAAADDAVKRLEAKGLPAFSRAGPGVRRAVWVGPYVSRVEALDAMKTVEALRFRNARVVVERPSRRESR